MLIRQFRTTYHRFCKLAILH